MLVDFNIDINLVQKQIDDLIISCKTGELDKEDLDLAKKWIKELKEVKSINDFITHIDKGVYEGEFDDYSIVNYCNFEFKQWHSFKGKHNFGTCDNVEQIINYYTELQSPNRKFFIIYDKIYRKDQPSMGGFRYRKNGMYIGNKKPISEYLYEDKHIDYILLYHIYEII